MWRDELSINFLRSCRVSSGRLGRIGVLCLSFVLALDWNSSASAVVLVDDTWQDGNRNQPDAPTNLITWAENDGEVGTDADTDLDLESRWFRSGTGSAMDPVGPGGPLRMTMNTAVGNTSSATFTTHFTDAEGNEVELVDVGDTICVTWVFTMDTVNATNGSQGMRIAIVDSPNLRITSNTTPAAGAYRGYATFGNMGNTFGHVRPFDLMTRGGGGGADGGLLDASDQWTSTGDNGTEDGTNGNAGYFDDVEYTYTFSARRLADDEVFVTMRMDGDGLDGNLKNYLFSSYTDTNPGTFKFDTFVFRPSQRAQTAFVFDTSLFRVELKNIPEPASLVLFSICGLSLLAVRRWQR